MLVQAGCTTGSGSAPSGVTPSASIAGRVTDAISGVPVAGARLLLRDTGEQASVAADGSFTLPASASAGSRVEIDAPGYWTRATRVDTAASAAAAIDVLPDGEGFSLPFFDYVFRQACQEPATLGTTRWVTQPTFEIWTQTFSCAAEWPGQTYGCLSIQATETPAPVAFTQAVTTVLDEDVTQYTGSVLSGVPVVQRTFAAGTIVTYPDDVFAGGRVAIVYVDRDDRGSIGAARLGSSTSITSGYIQILGTGWSDLTGLVSHEVAHTLGYWHPCGTSAVPLPSTMRDFTRPSAADRLHGRILYHRPSGSDSPDTDPDTYVVNAVASATTVVAH